MNCLGFIILVIAISCSAEKDTERKGRDSYIDAYQDSHGGSIEHIQQNSNDRESKYSPYYDNHLSEHYGPPNGYPGPEMHYPPTTHYGPPAYGPPNHIPRYNTYPGHFPLYEMPHAMLGLLDKFHLKLNIFTVLKILLKLVIFKKIISFIALICLLLFIPKFKMEKEEADDPDARQIISTRFQDEPINNLTNYVLNAIEEYSGRSDKNACKGINCSTDKVSNYLDNKYTYPKLLTMYAEETK